MDCPKCGSTEYCKDGKIKERQRYKCKRCVYRYTVTHKSDVKPQKAPHFLPQAATVFFILFLQTYRPPR